MNPNREKKSSYASEKKRQKTRSGQHTVRRAGVLSRSSSLTACFDPHLGILRILDVDDPRIHYVGMSRITETDSWNNNFVSSGNSLSLTFFPLKKLEGFIGYALLGIQNYAFIRNCRE